MKSKIWRFFVKILYYRNSSVDILKPFFENLHKNNINNEEQILKKLPQYQVEVLYKNGIISEEKYYSIFSKDEKNQSSFQIRKESGKENKVQERIEEIIRGDKVNELQQLIQEKNIETFNEITKPFNEVEEISIPLIQYCIMKKAINCFKYLLINGYDDPNKTMKEQVGFLLDNKHRYEWDCMATAIYFGNMPIVKILEDKGIEKGKNPGHIEAAILSYRNSIAEQIIEDKNKKIDLNQSIFVVLKNNNIKGAELLIRKGCNINICDKNQNSTKNIGHHFIMQQRIIQ